MNWKRIFHACHDLVICLLGLKEIDEKLILFELYFVVEFTQWSWTVGLWSVFDFHGNLI